MTQLITLARGMGKENYVRELIAAAQILGSMDDIVILQVSRVAEPAHDITISCPYEPQQRYKQKPNRPPHRIASPKACR